MRSRLLLFIDCFLILSMCTRVVVLKGFKSTDIIIYNKLYMIIRCDWALTIMYLSWLLNIHCGILFSVK